MFYYLKKFYNFVMKKPLEIASIKGNKKMISFLHKIGVDINMKVTYDKTPLDIACIKQDVEMIKLLLSKGAELDKLCVEGRRITPFYYAIKRDNMQMFTTLLEAIKDPANIGSNILFEALEKDDKSMAIQMIKKGVNINVTKKSGYRETPLEIAIHDENIELVKVLLEAGVNINLSNVERVTLREMFPSNTFKPNAFDILGIGRGSLLDSNESNIFKQYLSNIRRATMSEFAPVDITSIFDAFERNLYNRRVTPLLYAIYIKNREIAKMLVNAGADMEQFICTTITRTMKADVEMLKFLIREGKEIDLCDDVQFAVMGYAMENNDNELIKLLTEKIKYMDDKIKYSLMDYAMGKNDNELIKLLIERITYTDDELQFAVIGYATVKNDDELIKLLIEKNKYMNNKIEKAALIYAINRQNMELVELLIEKGTKIDFLDDNGAPILVGAMITSIEMAKYFIEHGANLNIVDSRFGRTPLIYAIITGNNEIAKLLIRKGADLNIKGTEEGIAPLVYAIRMRNLEIARCLIEAGANIEILDKEGATPLINSIILGNLEIAELLIDAGANINLPEKMSELTPLEIACRIPNNEAINMLIKHGAKITNEKVRLYILYNLDNELISDCVPNINDFKLQSLCYAKKKDITNLESNVNGVINSVKIDIEPQFASYDLVRRKEDIEKFGRVTKQNIQEIDKASEKIKVILDNDVIKDIKREIKQDIEAIKNIEKNKSNTDVNNEKEAILERLELNKKIIMLIKNAYRNTEKIVEAIMNAMYFPKNLKRVKECEIKRGNINNIIPKKDNINLLK